ncbi:MAG: carboxylesterase/lipase family protein [Promethearchaeota archaeon]
MKKTRIIQTNCGEIQGYIDEGVSIFKGIPYAAPPVGDLRFSPPESNESWNNVRDTTEFSPDVPQPPSFFAPKPVPSQSEGKSLTLNVWTPGLDGKKRPVMFWIHGGSYKTGGANRYNGIPLAKRGDVVIVIINYRLGPFGFLYIKENTANVGLLDQIAALKWVKNNISNFGGDPNNVTIFGESAGAGAICTLIGMPSAQGLFNRMISQSGGPSGNRIERAKNTTKKLASLLGIEPDDIDSLRKVTVKEIINAQVKIDADPTNMWKYGYSPIIDGKTLPKHPLEAVKSGKTKDIELLNGTNKDEMALWNLFTPEIKSINAIHERVKRIITMSGQEGKEDEKVNKIIEVYKKGRNSPQEILNSIMTDSIFRIPSIRLAEEQHKVQLNTFMYMFTWPSPMRNGELGACHAIEIPFVFGSLNMPRNDLFPTSNEETEAISRKMMDSWINFARFGNPNHDGIPNWPSYEEKSRSTMQFGAEIKVIQRPFDKERAVWDEII